MKVHHTRTHHQLTNLTNLPRLDSESASKLQRELAEKFAGAMLIHSLTLRLIRRRRLVAQVSLTLFVFLDRVREYEHEPHEPSSSVGPTARS